MGFREAWTKRGGARAVCQVLCVTKYGQVRRRFHSEETTSRTQESWFDKPKRAVQLPLMPNAPASAVQKVVDLVPRILYACRRLDARTLSTGRSLSPQQALILDQLDAEVPTSLQALAAQMNVTAPTMSVAIGRLVREGYVRRDRDEIDGRRLDLTLSAAGVRVRKSTSSLDPRRVASLLGRLSAADRAAALRGLTALADAARGEDRPAPRERADTDSRGGGRGAARKRSRSSRQQSGTRRARGR